MSILVYSEISSLFLDRIQANVSTDAPLSATEIARFINSAYAQIYELEGGSLKVVASATAWTTAQTATGTVAGILTDIGELINVWASTTSGSVGVSTGDYELVKVERAKIQFLRNSNITGTYASPKVYSTTRLATTTPASVGLLRLEYWPSVTGFYLPIAYKPTFTPIDSATVTTPDVSDIGSRDIPLLAAAQAAPLIGRAELVPGIMADVSEHTAMALKRKADALQTATQDQ